MKRNIDININKLEADLITLDPNKVYILSVKVDNIPKEQVHNILQHIRELLEKTNVNLNNIIFIAKTKDFGDIEIKEIEEKTNEK